VSRQESNRVSAIGDTSLEHLSSFAKLGGYVDRSATIRRVKCVRRQSLHLRHGPLLIPVTRAITPKLLDTRTHVRDRNSPPAAPLLSGIPRHVTQRGNRREQTFFADGDYALYRDLLAVAAGRAGVEIWAY
jgi:hypothetical protein